MKNKEQKSSGRSMIEMLAVLAIIGVLSITALVGFTYAMNKNRANETIYDVMLRGTNVPMIDENYYSKPSGYEFHFAGLGDGTYYAMATKKDSGRSYYVEATGVSYRVCEMILKMEPTDIDQILVGNTVYQGDSDICGSNDGLAMRFCFGSDGTICDGTGHGGSGSSGSGSGSGVADPCEGIDCGTHGICHEGVCECNGGYSGTKCDIAPECTDDAGCTFPKECMDYVCVCPTLDTPTECQEIITVNECDTLSNLPDGTECITDDQQKGICSSGSCVICSDTNSKACCEASGKLWIDNVQICMDVSDPCKGGEGTPYCPLYIDSTCTNPLYCCKTQIYKRYEKSGNNGIDAWGCLPEGYYLIPFEPFPAPCGTDMVCHYAACEGENDVAASFYISGCCPESCLVVSDGGGGLNCVDPNDTSSSCEVSEGWYK